MLFRYLCSQSNNADAKSLQAIGYIGYSDVYGHNTISMLWGNMAYHGKWEFGKILFPSFV